MDINKPYKCDKCNKSGNCAWEDWHKKNRSVFCSKYKKKNM